MRWPIAAALSALALLGACTSKDTSEDAELLAQEIERWRGTWRCIERNEEGELVPQEEVALIKLTVGGTMYHFEWGDDFDEFGRYEFRPGSNPKELDVHIESPPDMAGKVLKLIYRMDGDELMLVHREDGQRPTEFSAEPDSGQTEEVWKKIQ
jgi:uncharacterized protein (TIGR03067 family)